MDCSTWNFGESRGKAVRLPERRPFSSWQKSRIRLLFS